MAEAQRPAGGARARVAVVEDDDALREDILLPGLAAFDFEVEGFTRASGLYRRLLAAPFDVAVLDVGLPEEDGLSVARQLRAWSSIGIVMLTGRRHPEERVRALEDAADVWLAKPVDVDVVAATLVSLLRRMRMAPGAVASPYMPPPGWRLGAGGWRLHAPDGASVALTRAERQLLEDLFAAGGEVVARERLIATLGGNDYDFDPHRIDMLVHRLRRKVADELGQSLPLRAVRGCGYVLVEDAR